MSWGASGESTDGLDGGREGSAIVGSVARASRPFPVGRSGAKSADTVDGGAAPILDRSGGLHNTTGGVG